MDSCEGSLQNIKVNITTAGKRRLRPVIVDEKYREKFWKEKVSEWKKE